MPFSSDDLHFTPTLGSSNLVSISQFLLPSAQLRWQAVLSREQFEDYTKQGYQLQVWSNLTAPTSWSETNLSKASPLVGHCEDAQYGIDFFLGEPLAVYEEENDQVALEVTVPALSLLNRKVEFTYRMVDGNGLVLHWFGSPESNGTIDIHGTIPQAEQSLPNWQVEDAQGASVQVAPLPMHEDRLFSLNASLINFPWSIDSEGRVCSSPNIMPDTPLTALALLPSPSSIPNLITFSPTLYRLAKGHISLQTSDETHLLKITGENPTLHASLDISNWKEAIFAKDTVFLDVANSEQALAVVQNSSLPRIHFLPTSLSPAYISLDTSHISSLLTKVSAALIEPISGKHIILSPQISGVPIRIAVGRSGGDLLLSLVHSLEEWKVILIPTETGNIAVSTISSSTPSSPTTNGKHEFREKSKENGVVAHKSDLKDPIATAYFFALALQLLHMLFRFLPSSAPGSPVVEKGKFSPTPPMQEKSSPTLMFRADGSFKLIVHGNGDLSRVELRIDGNTCDVSPKPVEEGWMYSVTDFGEEAASFKSHEISVSVTQ